MTRRPLLALIALTLSACRDFPVHPESPTDAMPFDAVASELGATFETVSTIAFTSTRDAPTTPPLVAAEIYVMNSDGTSPRRLTANVAGDGFPALSPDGKQIVFDSNRLRTESEPLNTSDLFVMNNDGTDQTYLTRGSSATWSPDGRRIAFHASASGKGLPIRGRSGRGDIRQRHLRRECR